MDERKSHASLASKGSKASLGSRKRIPSATGGKRVDPRPVLTYQSSKQTRVLHILSAILDISVTVVLVALSLLGAFRAQMQLDGFICIAIIASWHLLLNIPLLLAIYRKWETGFAVYLVVGLSWVSASVAAEIYLIIVEEAACKKDTKTDKSWTHCFVPCVVLFGLTALQGILWHIFYRRWKQVKQERRLAKETKGSSAKLATRTSGTHSMAKPQGTISKGLKVGKTLQSQGGSKSAPGSGVAAQSQTAAPAGGKSAGLTAQKPASVSGKS